MNTSALSALADVICRAQKLDRTPMGIAFAIDTAGMHRSPETGAEHAALRARVAELEAERYSTNEALSDAAEQLRVQRDRITELEALTPTKYQTCRTCGAGYEYGFPCTVCAFKARKAAELHHATPGELAEQQHLVDPLDHDFERLAINLDTTRGTR